MKEFIDETIENEGTYINRSNLMALQGFISQTTVFKDDGSIEQTNSDGHTLTTTFKTDGNVTEQFVGNKTITKNTTFNTDGSISEVIS